MNLEKILIRFFAFWKQKLPIKIAVYGHYLKSSEIPDFVAFLEQIKSRGYLINNSSNHLSFDNIKSLHVSFDDNYYNWIEIAEKLHEHDIVATFFVNSGSLSDVNCIDSHEYFKVLNHQENDCRLLASKDLLYIRNLGHIIASHSFTHKNLNSIDFNLACNEIKRDKDFLENLLQEKIESFAFPFGMPRFFNNDLAEYCFKLGFSTICRAAPGCLYGARSSGRWLERTMYRPNLSLEDNMKLLHVDQKLFIKYIGKSLIL